MPTFNMTGFFEGGTANYVVSGDRVTISGGISVPSGRSIGAGDVVVGSLPADIPAPASPFPTAIGSLANVSRPAPNGAMSVNTGGDIIINLDSAYTGKATEFWEFHVTYPVFNGMIGDFQNNDSTAYSGYSIAGVFPESPQSITQGGTFDNDFYYVVGAEPGKTNQRPAKLNVIDRKNPDNSFIATGDLGMYLGSSVTDLPADSPNIIGHANGLSVLERKGDEVTLVVASMIPDSLGVIIVNTKTKVARLGTKIPTTGYTGGATSIQIEPNKNVIVRAPRGEYFQGAYNASGIKFTKMAVVPEMTAYIKSIGYDEVPVFQADWYDRTTDRFYITNWLATARVSVITEAQSGGANARSVPTGRYWYGSDNGRLFEAESNWIDNGALYVNISQRPPLRHKVIKTSFKL